MKNAARTIVNVFLVLAFLVSFIFSVVTAMTNMILPMLILAILIVYNFSVNEKFSRRKKTMIIAALFLGCLAYLAVPKKNTACGSSMTADRPCASHYCIGLPVSSFVPEPICIGYQFGKNY